MKSRNSTAIENMPLAHLRRGASATAPKDYSQERDLPRSSRARSILWVFSDDGAIKRVVPLGADRRAHQHFRNAPPIDGRPQPAPLSRALVKSRDGQVTHSE